MRKILELLRFPVFAAKTEGPVEVDRLRRRPLRDGDGAAGLRLPHPHRPRRQRQVRRQTLASHHLRIADVHSG